LKDSVGSLQFMSAPYTEQNSKQISVPTHESPHQLKLRFPNERLHALF